MRSLEEIKIVCLGGGTGLSTLLSGFKELTLHSPLRVDGHSIALRNLTGIVTVSDDGGSSGRIRDQFESAAPGDIRNCLVALASDESLMTQLFRYRFSGQGELKDHSLGNLLLTALTDITGDFVEAVKLSSQVLAVEGRILPATTLNCGLRGELCDGRQVYGETEISQSTARISRVFLEPGPCPLLPDAASAIGEADIITLGPGSLFTSLAPNLLVEGMAEAIRSSKAVRVYISNLMTQPGETDGFSTSDHLEALIAHSGGRNLFEHVLANTEPIPSQVRDRYLLKNAVPVRNDFSATEALGVHVHRRHLLKGGELVRLHPVRLAQSVLEIFENEKQPTRPPARVKPLRSNPGRRKRHPTEVAEG